MKVGYIEQHRPVAFSLLRVISEPGTSAGINKLGLLYVPYRKEHGVFVRIKMCLRGPQGTSESWNDIWIPWARIQIKVAHVRKRTRLLNHRTFCHVFPSWIVSEGPSKVSSLSVCVYSSSYHLVRAHQTIFTGLVDITRLCLDPSREKPSNINPNTFMHKSSIACVDYQMESVSLGSSSPPESDLMNSEIPYRRLELVTRYTNKYVYLCETTICGFKRQCTRNLIRNGYAWVCFGFFWFFLLIVSVFSPLTW